MVGAVITSRLAESILKLLLNVLVDGRRRASIREMPYVGFIDALPPPCVNGSEAGDPNTAILRHEEVEEQSKNASNNKTVLWLLIFRVLVE